MNLTVFVVLSALFFLNQRIAARPPHEPESNEERLEVRCVMEGEKADVIERLVCSPVGQDERTLGEILRQTQVFSTDDGVGMGPGYFRIPPSAPAKGFASTLAPRVKELHLIINGNFTITDDCLAGFSNLEFFNTNLFYPQESPIVSISSNAFRHTPNITQLRLVQDFYFPENTIKALESLKDQVIDLDVSGCKPYVDVIKLASKFTKLTGFYLNVYGRPSCPQNLFQNSAETLEKIHLLGCKMPQLPAAMLANLNSVTNLRLVEDDISTVEPGAFDQLPKLKGLYMMANKIKRLPNGIFEKNKMLEIVDFAQNGLENLSTGNFTHCPNFKQLCVGGEYCPF